MFIAGEEGPGWCGRASCFAAGLLAGFAMASAGARADERPKVELKGSLEMAANTSMSSAAQGSSSQASATGNAPNVVVPQMKSPLSLRPRGRASLRVMSIPDKTSCGRPAIRSRPRHRKAALR